MLEKMSCDRKKLITLVKKWSDSKKRNKINAQELEALAEACYRIALHPLTPSHEALSYLKEGYRIDGTNPRYAYHLSRIFFRQNKLEKASSWIKKAAIHNPTSHRIWTHVSLLQKELNLRYRGDSDYAADALRLRGQKIAEFVKSGEDRFSDLFLEFEPPKTKGRKGDGSNAEVPEEREIERLKAERTQNPGTCRWSGVVDLEIEDFLQSDARQINRDEMLPLMDQVLNLKDTRTAGTTAFSVLGIEWLLSGYSGGTLKRMLKNCPDVSTDPSVALLNHVMELFNAKTEKLPALLSAALVKKDVPPFLVSLIHFRRLLCGPLEFRAVGMYQLAKKFIQAEELSEGEDPEILEERDKRASAYIKSLLAAAEKMEPSEFTPIEDKTEEEVIETVEAQEADEILSELEKSATALTALKNEDAFNYLKSEMAPKVREIKDEASFSQISVDQDAFQAFFSILNRAADSGVAKIDLLTRQIVGGKSQAFGDTFVTRIDECRKAFNELKMPKGIGNFLKKIERGLRSISGDFTAADVPVSEPLKKIIDTAENIKVGDNIPYTESMEDTPTEKQEKEQARRWPDNLKGVDGIRKTLEIVDGEIRSLIKKRLATFREYSGEQLSLPALNSLQTMVKAEAAEFLFRLEKPRSSKKYWAAIIDDNWFERNALKNIAVSETLYAQDHARILAAWKTYCEVLYYYDILLNDPRHHAKERIQFHANFASAFAAGFTTDSAGNGGGKIDQNAFLYLINNPGQLTEFLAHKSVEFMNRRLNLDTPTLILGIERSASQERRKEELEVLSDYVLSTCSLLPERVRGGFSKVCLTFLRKSYDACETQERLTSAKNLDYDRDEQLYIHWIADVYHLKKQFFLALLDPKTWIHKVKYIDFLPLLDRINHIPTASSSDYLESAVSSMRLGEASTVIEHLDSFLVFAAMHLFQHILENTPADQKRRKNLFFQLAKSLEKHPEFWKKLAEKDTDNLRTAFKAIDDASGFFPQEVLTALKEDKDTEKAAAILTEWCVRYPALTGPARYAATLYQRLDHPKKAVPLLKTAAEKGFWKNGREECKKLMGSYKLPGQIQKFLKNKDYSKALDLVRQHMSDDPGSQSTLKILMDIYSAWIKNDPDGVKTKLDDIKDDFNSWLEKSEEKLQDKDIQSILRNRDILMANAAVAHLGKLDSIHKFEQVENVISRILEQSRGNIQAVYYSMVANYQLGGDLAKKRMLTEAQNKFKVAAEMAGRIFIESDSEEHKKTAQNIMEELDQIRKTMSF